MAEHHLQSGPGADHHAKNLRAEVQELLDQVTRALTTGDGAAMAALWDVPAFVIGDEAVMTIDTADQLAAFYGTARQQHNARGVLTTRADIRDLERVSDRLVITTVRWPYLDARGKIIGAEQADYTLRRDDAGALKIRSVMMRGIEPGTH